jgi:hypothetical protein
MFDVNDAGFWYTTIQMDNHDSIEALYLFNEKAEKLKRCSFTRSVSEKRVITISYKEDGSLGVERKGPDEESIDAFVLTYRFFCQDNEGSSFRNMEVIYNSLPISQQRKDLFKGARDQFNTWLDCDPSIKIDNLTITNREILDIFIYGGLAHANKRKKAIFDQWMSDPFLSQFMANEFVSILKKVMDFIIFVQNLNDEVIRELRENK